MKQNYSVLITAYATVLVIEAEDEDEAMEFAHQVCDFGDFKHDESKVEGVVLDKDLETAKRHADVVSEDV